MTRFVVGEDRNQSTLFPELLDDYVGDDNPVRAIDSFVDELDLGELRFGDVQPHATGRPAYHPATLLKIYIYGYLNRVQSSRRIERECQRNIELIWLTGRLAPDFKTIADFRTARASARSAASSLYCAGASISSATRVWPLMAASSKRSTRGTGTSRKLRCSGAWSRSTGASAASSCSSTARIASGRRYLRPRSRGLTRRLRRCAKKSRA